MGEMAEDAYVDDLVALAGFENCKPVRCRCCGQLYLFWGRVGGKWRLLDRGEVHRCTKNPLPEHRLKEQ